ncbi:MAG: hypothetical protein ACFCA4_12735 [Cyanophyceae cyanobacterium]
MADANKAAEGEAIASSTPNPKKTTTRRKRSPTKSSTAKATPKKTPTKNPAPPPAEPEGKVAKPLDIEIHPHVPGRKKCTKCPAYLSAAIAPGKLVCPHGCSQ